MPFSNNISNVFLKYILSKTMALPNVGETWMALSTNDPEADNGTFNELSGKAYERVLVSKKGAEYPDFISDVENRTAYNTKQINWTKATEDWDRVKGFALYNAKTDGEMLYYGKIELSPEDEAAGGLEVKAGAVALFDPRAFRITIASTDTVIAAAE